LHVPRAKSDRLLGGARPNDIVCSFDNLNRLTLETYPGANLANVYYG